MHQLSRTLREGSALSTEHKCKPAGQSSTATVSKPSARAHQNTPDHGWEMESRIPPWQSHRVESSVPECGCETSPQARSTTSRQAPFERRGSHLARENFSHKPLLSNQAEGGKTTARTSYSRGLQEITHDINADAGASGQAKTPPRLKIRTSPAIELAMLLQVADREPV